MEQCKKAKPGKGEKEWNQVWKPFPFIRMVIRPQNKRFSNILLCVSFQREWIYPLQGHGYPQTSRNKWFKRKTKHFCKFANLRVVFLSQYLLGQLNIYRLSWVPVLFNLCPVSSFNFSQNKWIQQIHKHCCENSKKHQRYGKFAQLKKKPAPITAEKSSRRSAESV